MQTTIETMKRRAVELELSCLAF